MNLLWGVQTFFYDGFSTTDETFEDKILILKNNGIVKEGDIVVNTGSMPIHKRGRTNMMKITEVE
jgi:pyruvate kinase